MAGPGDLYAAAEELLAAAALALEDAPAGPIENQVIWPGPPSYDCIPALYVHAGGNSVGDTYPLQPPLQPMQRITNTGFVDLVAFTITVLRCGTTLRGSGQTLALPARQAIKKTAAETYGDLWAIWNGLKNQHLAGTLFQSPSKRREFQFDPAVPIRAQGQAIGWEITVRVQLGGYS